MTNKEYMQFLAETDPKELSRYMEEEHVDARKIMMLYRFELEENEKLRRIIGEML